MTRQETRARQIHIYQTINKYIFDIRMYMKIK